MSRRAKKGTIRGVEAVLRVIRFLSVCLSVCLFVCLSQFHAPANIAPRELRFFLIDSSQKVFLQWWGVETVPEHVETSKIWVKWCFSTKNDVLASRVALKPYKVYIWHRGITFDALQACIFKTRKFDVSRWLLDNASGKCLGGLKRVPFDSATSI